MGKNSIFSYFPPSHLFIIFSSSHFSSCLICLLFSIFSIHHQFIFSSCLICLLILLCCSAFHFQLLFCVHLLFIFPSWHIWLLIITSISIYFHHLLSLHLLPILSSHSISIISIIYSLFSIHLHPSHLGSPVFSFPSSHLLILSPLPISPFIPPPAPQEMIPSDAPLWQVLEGCS